MSNRPDPDLAALAVAHKMLATSQSLESMLQSPPLKAVLFTVARRHMQRRGQIDIKKLQSHDD